MTKPMNNIIIKFRCYKYPSIYTEHIYLFYLDLQTLTNNNKDNF
jgi:hypothetical protein